MRDLKIYKEILDLCSGVQHDKDVFGWKTLHEFDNFSPNKSFNAKVYKRGNKVVIAIAGTNMKSANDIKNDIAIWNNQGYQHIPSQYKDAEELYIKVRDKFKNTGVNIEFAGYSLGGTLANLLSHRTGLSSTAIAPIGSKHIAEAYPNYFKYKGNNITTFGRKSDILFYKNIRKQSGNINIVPDLPKGQLNNVEFGQQHLLHNYSPYQLYKSKPYAKMYTQIPTSYTAPVNYNQVNSFLLPALNLYNLLPANDKSDVVELNTAVVSDQSAGAPDIPKISNQHDYNNLPEADFSLLFPKTQTPQQLLDVVSPQKISLSSINDLKYTKNESNNTAAQTALLALIDVILNRRRNNLSDFTNPLTGNPRIYTREEVDQMSRDEFSKNEKEIMAQVKAMGGRMPTNNDMQEEAAKGGAVYVNAYTRQDGMEVCGYWRSRPAY